MIITDTLEAVPWILLIFSLPSKKTSERVGIWRKLQKYGALALRNSGYVLPNSPENQEKFEWLAKSIRGFKGEASVLEVQAIDDLSPDAIKEMFREARKPDYIALIREIRQHRPSLHGSSGQLLRLKRRLEETVEIDFFGSPLRAKAEEGLYKAEHPIEDLSASGRGRASRSDYQNRNWLTRPRPGIDRVSSAWFIRRFVDSNASFAFGEDPAAHPDSVPFDMYQPVGFGHKGDRCTFETLCTRFGVVDKKVRLLSQAIHDADLEDEKFGRTEGIAINQVLKGWAKQGLPDEELLRRGIDIIEGLFHSIG